MRRVLLLLLLIACAIAAAGATHEPARAQIEPPGLGTIRAAYDDLLGLSYAHPQPAALLKAAWDGIAAALQPGEPAPPPLPTLPQEAGAAFDAFATAYTGYIQSYQKGTARGGSPDALALAAAGAMAQATGEPHTHLIIGDLTDLTGGAQFGIGIQARAHPPVIVTAVAPDSPAQRAGLQLGDEIAAIDGRSVASMADLAPPLSTVRGNPIVLTIRRGGRQQQLQLTPSGFNFPLLTSRLLSDGIAYLRLNDFGINNAYFDNLTRFTSDLDQRLDDFDARGAKALVLDLRDNGSNDLAAVAALLGRFLPEGTLTIRAFTEGGEQAFGAVSGTMHARQLPIVVLIDGGTSAAAEVAAGVLQATGRALLVGEKSAGSLAATRVIPISENGALQIGLARATLAINDRTIDGAGLTPDVAVPDTRTGDDIHAGRDPELDAAVQAVPHAPAPPAATPVASLATILAVHRLLAGYVPALTGLLMPDGVAALLEPLDAADIASPSELATEDVADPAALVASLRAHGWLGRHAQTFNVIIDGMQPELVVTIDAYATPSGAAAALRENPFPAVQQLATPPVTLGDATVAYSGRWLRSGWTTLSWQRANVIATVTYAAPPGAGGRTAAMLAGAAAKIDDALQRYPVTGETFQANLRALAAATPALQATTAAAPANAPRPASASTTATGAAPVQNQGPLAAAVAPAHHGGLLSANLVLTVLAVLALLAMGGYVLRRA